MSCTVSFKGCLSETLTTGGVRQQGQEVNFLATRLCSAWIMEKVVDAGHLALEPLEMGGLGSHFRHCTGAKQEESKRRGETQRDHKETQKGGMF